MFVKTILYIIRIYDGDDYSSYSFHIFFILNNKSQQSVNNYLNPNGETLPTHNDFLLGVYILTVFILVVVSDPGSVQCCGGRMACSDSAVDNMLAGRTMDL